MKLVEAPEIEKCKFQINDLRIFSVSCVTNLYAVMVYCGFLARSFRRILSTKSRLVLRNMKGTHPPVISFSKTILAAGAKSKTCSSSCQLLSENQSAVIGSRKLEARDRNILEKVILKYQKKFQKYTWAHAHVMREEDSDGSPRKDAKLARELAIPQEIAALRQTKTSCRDAQKTSNSYLQSCRRPAGTRNRLCVCIKSDSKS